MTDQIRGGGDPGRERRDPRDPRNPSPPPAVRDQDFDRAAVSSLRDGPAAPLRRRHPPGLSLLFATEMWERFSYYGMRALLFLFMTRTIAEGGLEMSTAQAGAVYGTYTGLAYLAPVIGGYIADKLLGTHRSMVLGGLVIAAGHFCLVFEGLPWFFAGLTLIIIGTGFFKPCVSTMVGQLYEPGDSQRDAGFTIFYMGINLGAFLAPLICGWLRVSYGWHWGFGAAGVGMVLGVITYLIGKPWLLAGVGAPPERPDHKRAAIGTAVLLLIAPLFMAYSVFPNSFGPVRSGMEWIAANSAVGYTLSALVAVGVIAGIATFILRLEPGEKGPVAAIFIMSFFVIFFWTAFEQAGSSMNLFAEEKTDRTLPASLEWFVRAETGFAAWWFLAAVGAAMLASWATLKFKLRTTGGALHALRLPLLIAGAALLITGVVKSFGGLNWLIANPEYPAEWWQSANPLFILMFAPVFAAIWTRLGARGREPSTPVKFAMGLLLLSGGFVFMVLGARAAGTGDSAVRVAGYWLLGAYFLHTMGELCLSPVGLSLVTKLAPVRFASVLMGVWFLANFVSNKLAGSLAGKVDEIEEKGLPVEVFGGQADFFLIFVVAPAAAGVVLLAITPLVKRLIGGRA